MTSRDPHNPTATNDPQPSVVPACPDSEPLQYAAPGAKTIHTYVVRRWRLTLGFFAGIVVSTEILRFIEHGYSRAWLAIDLADATKTAFLVAAAASVPFALVLHFPIFREPRTRYSHSLFPAFLAGIPLTTLIRVFSTLAMPPDQYHRDQDLLQALIIIVMMVIYPTVLAYLLGRHSE